MHLGPHHGRDCRYVYRPNLHGRVFISSCPQTMTSGYPCSLGREKQMLSCRMVHFHGNQHPSLRIVPSVDFRPFVRLLESQDDFVQLKTTQIMTVLLRYDLHLVNAGTHLTSHPAPSQHLYPPSSLDPSSTPSQLLSLATVRTNATLPCSVLKPSSLVRNAAELYGRTRPLWEGE